MPTVVFHKQGQRFTGDVANDTNLVVRAGIRQFPYPHLAYGCGMGKCGKCVCRIISGHEHLPPPNWKERRRLADRLDAGERLACQLWITHDIELTQDVPALPPEVRDSRRSRDVCHSDQQDRPVPDRTG